MTNPFYTALNLRRAGKCWRFAIGGVLLLFSSLVQALDFPLESTPDATCTPLQAEYTGTGLIDSATLRFSATTTRTAQVDIYLQAPSGDILELARSVGGAGDDFNRTLFDDSATLAISEGSAPFRDSYRPQGGLDASRGACTLTPTISSFAELVDQDPVGIWTLWVNEVNASFPTSVTLARLLLQTSEPGVALTPTTELISYEVGADARFDVTLTRAPTASVTLNFSSSDPGEGVPNPSSMTFNASNWNIPQTLRLEGVDDGLDDGHQTYQLQTDIVGGFGSDQLYITLSVADISLTSVSPAAGTFWLTPQQLGTANSYDVALGDVDGDGDLDAWVANSDEPNRVWLNDGNANFSDSGQTLGENKSYGVALADLDGDGDLDAVVANYSNGGESNIVWLNDGAGNFSDNGQTLANSRSRNVALGDIDGDGDLDIVDTDYVWFNDGNGQFTELALPGDHVAYTVALGDVDADGDLDLWRMDSSYSLDGNVPFLWLNDGTGNFSDSGQVTGLTVSAQYVALGDVDGDGDVDAWITLSDSGNSYYSFVWLNNGSGLFSDSGQWLAATSRINDIQLADLDNDGDLDAWVAQGKHIPDRIWMNDGSGLFTLDDSQYPGVHETFGVALGDLDGDGDLDAWKANQGYTKTRHNRVWLNHLRFNVTGIDPSSNALDVAPNQSVSISFTQPLDPASLTVANATLRADNVIVPGSWQALNNTLTFTPSVNYRAGTTLNLNLGATLQDMAGAYLMPYQAQFSVATLATAGSFQKSCQVLGSDSGTDVDFGDVDGDGDLDAWTALDNAWDRLWSNDGSGQFTDSGQQFPVYQGMDTPQFDYPILKSLTADFGDLDGDGDLDVWAGGASAGAQIWWNDGSGQFPDGNYPPSGYVDIFLQRLADVDSDGDLDAIAASNSNGQLYLNQGVEGLVFSGTRDLFEGDLRTTTDMGDLDNDGALDFWNARLTQPVILNRGGNFVLSAWTFNGATALPRAYIDVALGDVDGDGDLDAFTVKNDSRVGVYNNLWINEGGAFSLSPQALGGGTRIAFADVDGDGDLDAWIITYEGAYEQRLLLNDGAGVFSDSGQDLGSATLGSSRYANNMRFADLDDDGDLDAWVVGKAVSEIWFNQSPIMPSLSLAADVNSGSEAGGTEITLSVSADFALDSTESVALQVSGSGIEASDYNLSATSLSLSDCGVATATLTILDDADIEGAETLTVTLINPSSGVVLGTTVSQAIVIEDDEAPDLDNTPPVLSLPGDIIAEASSALGASISYSASANDAVDGAVSVDCIPASGSTFAIGATTVNCSASDNAGNNASDSFTVTVNAVSATPLTLSAPVNNSTASTATPVFVWSADAAADSYEISVNDVTGNVINSSYSAAALSCSTSCSLSAPLNLAQGAVYWRVRAVYSGVAGPWSDIGNFTIELTPTAPTLTDIGNTSDSTPTYEWTASPLAVSYRLMVNDNTGNVLTVFHSPSEVGCAAGTGLCSVTPSISLSPGTVYWEVRGVSATGHYGEVATGSFTLAPAQAASAPVNLSPATGTTLSTLGSFSWDAVAGAQRYRLQINNGSSVRYSAYFTPSEASCAAVCSVTPNLSGAVAGKVYWRVVADSFASTVQNFNYAP
jgi:hypothetical protein